MLSIIYTTTMFGPAGSTSTSEKTIAIFWNQDSCRTIDKFWGDNDGLYEETGHITERPPDLSNCMKFLQSATCENAIALSAGALCLALSKPKIGGLLSTSLSIATCIVAAKGSRLVVSRYPARVGVTSDPIEFVDMPIPFPVILPISPSFVEITSQKFPQKFFNPSSPTITAGKISGLESNFSMQFPFQSQKLIKQDNLIF